MKKGFTLTELLVVIFIISLLTSISFPFYRTAQKQYILKSAAQKLAQDIRRAQEMAISARICGPCGNKVPPGYGIYLQQGNTSYLIYADTNPAQGNEIYDGGDVIIETISFEGGVFIKNVNPSSLSINFQPPDPKIRIIGDSSPPLDEVSIVLSLSTDTSKTKTIKVNKAGLIYVE
jgi:prepilin-type N-terminal cleavage/methylation domain-containing protein